MQLHVYLCKFSLHHSFTGRLTIQGKTLCTYSLKWSVNTIHEQHNSITWTARGTRKWRCELALYFETALTTLCEFAPNQYLFLTMWTATNMDIIGSTSNEQVQIKQIACLNNKFSFHDPTCNLCLPTFHCTNYQSWCCNLLFARGRVAWSLMGTWRVRQITPRHRNNSHKKLLLTSTASSCAPTFEKECLLMDCSSVLLFLELGIAMLSLGYKWLLVTVSISSEDRFREWTVTFVSSSFSIPLQTHTINGEWSITIH